MSTTSDVFMKKCKIYLGPDCSIVSLTTSLRHQLVKYMPTTLSNTLLFLLHLLIARCDIGVQLSVRSFVRPSVSPQFMSRCLLFSSDSLEYETLHSNYP